MTNHAQGTFTGGHWKEEPYDAPEGLPRLHRATEQNTFTGDLQGTGTMSILISYSETGGSFAGFERFTGTLGGKTGSFVVRQTGEFVGRTVENTLNIVPGTGTGELKGIHGQGHYTAEGMEPTPYTLDYDFDAD
jgi:hypothetical protein